MSDPSGRFNLRTAAFPLYGFAIGAVGWSGHVYALPAVLVLPILLRVASDRARFLAAVAGYNAGATWTLVPGASIFYGHHFSPVNILLLWSVVIAILSLPWLIIEPFGPVKLKWGLPLAIIIAAILPTGVVNPITTAGVLFPGTGWAGLILTLALFGALAVRPLSALAGTLCLALICNISFPGDPAVPQDWKGVNTQFGGSGLDAADYRTAYRDALAVQQTVATSNASVIVFPEAIVKTWTPVTDLMWQDTFRILRDQGKTLIVGAEIPLPGHDRYANVLIVRGEQHATYQQRIPLPYAMWMPWTTRGVPLNYAGPATITIHGQRVAPIICYEQLLVAPVLASMREHPSLLIGAANDYWARGTFIANIQSSSLSAWSRLFRVPAVMAVNE